MIKKNSYVNQSCEPLAHMFALITL